MPSLLQRARALLGPEVELTPDGLAQLVEPDADEDPSVITLSFEGEAPRALSLDLSQPFSDEIDDYDDSEQIEWALAALSRLAGPPAAQLRALRVTPMYDYSGDLNRQWLADALSRLELSGLRSLSWGNEEVPCFVEVPDLSALLDAAPALRALHILGDWEDENPRLLTRRLQQLSLLALRPSLAEAVAEFELDALEQLRLRLFDDEDEGGEELWLEDLQPLFDRPLPALRSLSLTHCPFGPGLIEALPEVPWFEQLGQLSLFDARDGVSYLPEACGERLLHADFAHLSIDVTGAFCDPRRAPTTFVQRLRVESEGRITTG